MSPPVWEHYIQQDGTLRYHFRDFIDYLADQLPPGTITIFELFNEIMDCNGFSNPSWFLDDSSPTTQCTASIYDASYVNPPDGDPAGMLSNAGECLDALGEELLTTNKWDYFDVLALPSERAAGVKKENKAQIWCELALRARAKWGFPAAALNDYDISPDSGGGRAQYAVQVVRRIAETTLTTEQKQSLVGLYDDVDSLQCIDAIDVIGMQSHYGVRSINEGNEYTPEAINAYIEDRQSTVNTMATALQAEYNKILEVHFTESKLLLLRKQSNTDQSMCSLCRNRTYKLTQPRLSARSRLPELPLESLQLRHRPVDRHALPSRRRSVDLPRSD